MQSSTGNRMALTTSNRSLNAMNPGSFKAALDQIEEEIMMLAAEVNYCKKEVAIQKSELDTICDVSNQQCFDIEKYLRKEV